MSGHSVRYRCERVNHLGIPLGVPDIFNATSSARVRFGKGSDRMLRTLAYHFGGWRMTTTSTHFRDEDARWSRWAGGDLGPLAHESALTVFWRFCWRNVMDPVRTRESFADQGVRIDWKQFQKASYRVAYPWTGRALTRLPVRRAVACLPSLSRVCLSQCLAPASGIACLSVARRTSQNRMSILWWDY
jgi:hypothetical protein